MEALRAAEPDSPAEIELQRREDWLNGAVSAMQHWDDDHWWDGESHHNSDSSTASRNDSMKNGTGGAVNLTQGCSSNDCNGGTTVA